MQFTLLTTNLLVIANNRLRAYAYTYILPLGAYGRGITEIGWARHRVPVDYAPFRLREGVGYPT